MLPGMLPASVLLCKTAGSPFLFRSIFPAVLTRFPGVLPLGFSLCTCWHVFFLFLISYLEYLIKLSLSLFFFSWSLALYIIISPVISFVLICVPLYYKDSPRITFSPFTMSSRNAPWFIKSYPVILRSSPLFSFFTLLHYWMFFNLVLASIQAVLPQKHKISGKFFDFFLFLLLTFRSVWCII